MKKFIFSRKFNTFDIMIIMIIVLSSFVIDRCGFLWFIAFSFFGGLLSVVGERSLEGDLENREGSEK